MSLAARESGGRWHGTERQWVLCTQTLRAWNLLPQHSKSSHRPKRRQSELVKAKTSNFKLYSHATFLWATECSVPIQHHRYLGLVTVIDRVRDPINLGLDHTGQILYLLFVFLFFRSGWTETINYPFSFALSVQSNTHYHAWTVLIPKKLSTILLSSTEKN